MIMEGLLTVVVALFVGLWGGTQSCVVPPYADSASRVGFTPRDELSVLLLEGRCFLACLDSEAYV